MRAGQINRGVSVNVVTDKVMTDVEAAYVAGFLDGEGTLTIGRERREGNLSGRRYRAVLQIANSHRASLERVREMCGNGRIVGNYHKGEPHHKVVYVLVMTPHQIRHVLPQIQKYLTVKAEQAAILRTFLSEVVAGRRLTVDIAARQEALRSAIRTLNHRGQDTNTPVDPVFLRPAKPNRWQQEKANRDESTVN